MRRSLVPLILGILLCAALGYLLLRWRPFASNDADTVQLTPPPTEIARQEASPTFTPSPLQSATRRATMTRRPTGNLTASPRASSTANQTHTPLPASTPRPPRPSITPGGPTFENEMTATAFPAQATVDAMATRSYSGYENTPGPSPTARAIDRTENVLLMGSDQRVGDPTWNTDVMMIVFLDFANKRIGVLSLPRDMIVPIPSHDANRINETDVLGELGRFPGGGPGMLSFVLRDQFKIRIQYYARVGFQGFDKIIDTVGGIDVNVPCAIEDTIDEHHFVIPAGLVHMDALTAQQYVRSRNTTSDLSRNARQQRVIRALAQRLLEIDALSKAFELWDQLHDALETDATLFDILRLGQAVSSLDLKNHPERVHAHVLEPPEVYDWITAEGAYVFLPDYDAIEGALNRLFDAPQIGTTTATECVVIETPPPTSTPTLTP